MPDTTDIVAAVRSGDYTSARVWCGDLVRGVLAIARDQGAFLVCIQAAADELTAIGLAIAEAPVTSPAVPPNGAPPPAPPPSAAP